MEKQDLNHATSFNFLTEIYDVMKCFENNPSKLGNKINELKLKFDSARSLLSNLPGIDMSYTEQQDYYESLLKQYNREKQLLESYKDICKFDITELEKGPSESFLNPVVSRSDEALITEITEKTPLMEETDKMFHEPLKEIEEHVSISEEYNLMELDNFTAQ